MRLIDADALVDVMTGACNIFDAQGLNTTFARVLITIADKAPTVGRWISVKDRLPEENLEYLVYATDEDGERFVTTDHWNKYVQQWYIFDKGSPTTVTHWMTLPEPPGGLKNEL